MKRFWVLSLCLCTLSPAFGAAGSSPYYQQGLELYKAGRYSDATDAFEQAVRKRDHTQESQDYIDRIRKETVDRIRNRALTGVNKSSWQSKFYFMNLAEGKVRVGISAQEVFERDSLNFRPGAVEALKQLAEAIAKAETAHVDIDFVNEINQDVTTNHEILDQQLTAVFSYLSLAARGLLPKY